MDKQAVATEMVKNIEVMPFAQLREFVLDKDKVDAFFGKFEQVKSEFVAAVKAQAEIDQINKLLLQAEHDRGMAEGELRAAREKATKLKKDSEADRSVAQAALKSAKDMASSANAAAERTIAKADQRAAKIVSDAEAEKTKADAALAAAERLKAAMSAREKILTDKEKVAKELIGVLNG